MPCAFHVTPNNPLGHAYIYCQFDDLDRPFITVDGQEWCLFHCPMTDKDNQPTQKANGSLRPQIFDDELDRRLEAALAAAAVDPATVLNLTGVVFPHVSFKNRKFPAVSFAQARFSETAIFEMATFGGTAGFEETTFSGRAWFEKTTFNKRALFEKATFSKGAGFEEAMFKGEAWFLSVAFGKSSGFQGATFTEVAGFDKVIFTEDAAFPQAIFSDAARFHGATFGGTAGFEETTFERTAWFEKVTFRDDARFTEATFGREAGFPEATFHGEARFEKVRFGGAAGFEEATFSETAIFQKTMFGGYTNFSASGHSRTGNKAQAKSFPASDFSHAAFSSTVTFENRQFLRAASFDGCLFTKAPIFHSCRLPQGTTFPPRLNFKDVISEGAVKAYQTLKFAMEQVRGRREESMFYALEHQARRHHSDTPRPEKLIAGLYEWTADYGESFLRPLGWLLLVTELFIFLYASTMTAFFSEGTSGYDVASLCFAIEQVIRPFSGWGTTSGMAMQAIFPREQGLPFFIKLLSSIQSLINVGLLGLFVFAVRRKFKLG